MPQTPFFSPWRARLAPRCSRLAATVHTVRAYTLCQMENRFADWIPASLFPKAARKHNSRDRDYTRGRTFWCMLWQSFNPSASGREVVRQLQALFRLQDGPVKDRPKRNTRRTNARLRRLALM